MVSQPFLLMKNMWYMHDRRGNYVARDYAYNMLAPLAPNAFMFTNGDNDTFPLWYLQQVEGIRKDVRVVNLSLLNTDWYIRQLRDEEPKVPISLNDQQIDALGAGVVRDTNGDFVYTSHFMVDHIMREDRTDHGWKRPPYFAVTVPERQGYDKYFTLEGLVYRVNSDTTGPRLDEPATRKAMYQTFMYRGLFKPDGSWDPSVYKDENAATLSRNYAAAHMELAYYYRRLGRLQEGIAEMERVERMFPGSPDVLLPLGSFYVEAGDTARAMRLFDDLAKKAPNDPDVRYYHGVSLLFQNKLEAALTEFQAAIALDPENTQSYIAAYSLLMEGGQRERALGILEQWTKRHPEDPEARGLFERGRKQPGSEQPGTEPPTRAPNLP
jgi:tetratricopeptide (TPR) repeat protein